MFGKLVKYYIDYFYIHGESVLTMLCNCKVPGDIILSEYKKLPPIETLPEDEKIELYEYAKENYPNGSKDLHLRFIKIVYTVGTLS